MKVLVLSCSTGGGHNACGRYIEHECRACGADCDFADYFEIFGPKAKARSERWYLDTTKGNGNVFRVVYRLGEFYSRTGITSPVFYLNKLGVEKFRDFLHSGGYDVVVATHLFPAMAATALKQRGDPVKLVNVATDYHAIPFWDETEPDVFVIPHKSLCGEFVKKGFKRKVLCPLGIPVASDFLRTKSPRNLPATEQRILVMSGSMGFGKMQGVVQQLLAQLPDAGVVAVCGKNQELYRELSQIHDPRLVVHGFVRGVNNLMAACDVVLTKPGGLTSTEAAVLRRPLVHMMPIPGVENYNAEFFRKHGLSLPAADVPAVVAATQKLLTSPKLCAKMAAKQEKFINAHAARDLVELIRTRFDEN